jgi:hypothetical protein
MKPKKKRTYKGKEIERTETDRERKDRLFPGSDDLKKLSIGIQETTPEDEDSLIDDEEEQEDDYHIPLKWAELASSNLATQNKMKQTIKEARIREKKKDKPKKKNCEPGNPFRDELGRLSSVEDAASWSIGNQDGVGRSDCNYGKKKKTGSGRSTSWTKRECGREDVTDPNVKAKHRCKDGSVVKEQDEEQSDWDKTIDPHTSELGDRLQSILDKEPDFIKHLTFLVKPLIDIGDPTERRIEKMKNHAKSGSQREKTQSDRTKLIPVSERSNRHKGMNREQIRTLCSASGFFGWSDFLLKLSAIEQAKKGSINQTKNN